MSFMNHWKIGRRLSVGFGLLIAIAVGMAVIAFAEFGQIRNDMEQLRSNRLVKVRQLTEVKDNLNVIARSVRNLVLMSDEDASGKQAEAKRIEDMRKRNTELLAALDKTLVNEANRTRLAEITAALRPYDAAMNKAIALGMANDDAPATQMLLKDVRPLQAASFKAVDGLIEYQQKLMNEAVDGIHRDAAASNTLMLVLAVAAIISGGLLAWWLQRSVVGPLRQAVEVARTVAAGDLRCSIVVRSRDETGELLQAMKEMVGALANLVSQVRESSESIATGSAQIATGSADLSQRTEEQASNLEQTTASMAHLRSGLRQSADTAMQANALALRGIDAAQRGGQAVSQMVATMQEISTSSRKVADIISVIDAIAFQTNILALNAAVEAARAGEQGRGFAVVAGEVRSLAQRCASAAREIKTLIQRSVEGVEAGAQHTESAGQQMNTIVAEVQGIGELIRDITGATAEQSDGISQIGEAVNQLDQVTQQNAALVEESTAAAESLREQAARLAELVRSFKLAEAQEAG